jgi:gliding motility-associated-like protein
MSDTTLFVDKLKADLYGVFVTDDNGCEAQKDIYINEPQEPLLASLDTIIHAHCFGDNSGQILRTTSGGIPPYNWDWNNGETSEDATNIYAGTHILNLSDANSCEFIDTIIITHPDKLIATTEQLNADCNGNRDAYAKVIPKGGTIPYTYLWSTGSVNDSIHKIAQGTHSVTVTDKLNCTVVKTVDITQPNDITFTHLVDSVNCYGFSDGSITVEVFGGTEPYYISFGDSTFSKINTENSYVLNNVPKGMYNVTVIDKNQCVVQKAIQVYEPDTLHWSVETVDVKCYREANGSIDLTIWGGTPSYNYLWNSGDSIQDIDSLVANNYEVTVSDHHGCTIIAYAWIEEPQPLILESDVYDVTCRDQQDGKIQVYVSGGIEDYSYLWSNDGTSDNIYELPAGKYYIVVRDSNDCIKTDTFNINVTDIDCIDPPTAFTPDGDDYNDTWHLENIHLFPNAEVQVFNKWGQQMFYSKGEYTAWDGTFKGGKLPAATYYYIIDLHNGSAKYTGPVTIVKGNTLGN